MLQKEEKYLDLSLKKKVIEILLEVLKRQIRRKKTMNGEDGGAGGASSMNGRLPDHLRKHRTNERQYVFDVAFGADSTQVQIIINVEIIKHFVFNVHPRLNVF